MALPKVHFFVIKLAVATSLPPGQRIKKAPGKYVVLGGRRTDALRFREPVVWSSTKNLASMLCSVEPLFEKIGSGVKTHPCDSAGRSVRSIQHQVGCQCRTSFFSKSALNVCCQTLNTVGRIEGTFSSGQGGFGRDFRKLEIHPSVLSMRQHLQGYHLRSDCGLILRTQTLFQIVDEDDEEKTEDDD